MNRKEWKIAYNNLSNEIRAMKKHVKESDRAFAAGLKAEGKTYFAYWTSNSKELTDKYNAICNASYDLLLLKQKAHSMMLELESIKEESRKEWEAKHSVESNA